MIINLIVLLAILVFLGERHSNALKIPGGPTFIRSRTMSFHAKIDNHATIPWSRLYFRVAEQDQKVIVPPSINPALTQNNIKSPKKTQEAISIKQVTGNNPVALLEKLTIGIVPVAATVGFVIVPTQKLAFRAAGAAAGAAAGFFAKSVIDKRIMDYQHLPEFELVKKGVLSVKEDSDDDLMSDATFRSGFSKEVVDAVKFTLKSRKDLLTYTEEALERIASKFEVKEEELSLYFTTVLSEAILRETAGKSLNLLDLSAIIDFVEEIGFSKHEIGNAIGFAAVKIGKSLKTDDRGFLKEIFPIATLLQASKLFFLADKLIENMEGFYGKRISLLLNSFFMEESYQLVITDSCKNLFSQCVQTVLKSSSARLSREDVKNLEAFLATSNNLSQMSPLDMQTLIMEAVRGKLEADLQPFKKAESLRALLTDYDKIVHVRDVFGWNRADMIATLDAQVIPVYQDVVTEVLEQVHQQPSVADEWKDVLLKKAQDLRLSIPKARKLVLNAVKSYNDAYLDRIQKVFAASGESLPAVYKIMITQANVLDAFEKVTQQIMSGSKIPFPVLPFPLQTRQLLYQHRKGDMVHTRKIRSETTLNDLFELSDEEKQIVTRAMTTPKIISWIAECISQNTLNEDAKNAYWKMLQETGVTEESWQPTALDFYYQEVKKLAEARTIPSTEEMDHLENLAMFLQLSDSNVRNVRVELLGEKYIKAVTEAMAVTGVITDQYAESLIRLRDRLRLSEEDAKVLGAVAARDRLTPMIESIVDIWKSNTNDQYRFEKMKREAEEIKNSNSDSTKNKKRLGKIKGQNPEEGANSSFGFVDLSAAETEPSNPSDLSEEGKGPENFMREVLNMVEMVSSNLAVHDTAAIPEAQNSTLINAISMVPEADLVGVFKYFLLARLTETQTSLRQRYEAIEPSLINILGIAKSSVQKVKESVAYTSFKSILHNALLYKESVQPSDLQQFVRLKSALPLEDEQHAEMIYLDARTHAAIDHATAFFAKILGNTTNTVTGKPYPIDPVLQAAFPELKKRPISPADARIFRNQVSSMGLSMREVGFSSNFLSLLFAMEIQHAIEEQMLSPDELSDIQDAYEIDSHAAEMLLEASVKKYLSQEIALTLTAAKRYNDTLVVDHVSHILRYLDYLSDTAKIAADGNLFTVEDVKRMVTFYLSHVEDRVSALQEEVEALRAQVSSESDLTETKKASLTTDLHSAEEQLSLLSGLDRHALAERLQQLIYLSRDFEPPLQGIAGLMGNLRSETSDDKVELDSARKKWSWD